MVWVMVVAAAVVMVVAVAAMEVVVALLAAHQNRTEPRRLVHPLHLHLHLRSGTQDVVVAAVEAAVVWRTQ